MSETSTTSLNDAKRLKLVLDTLDISAYKLAKTLGYKTPSSVYHITEGRNQLSSDMIQGIIKEYPRVNYLFLKEGKGEVLLKRQSEIIMQQNMFGFSKEKPVDISEEEEEYSKESETKREYYLKQICDHALQTNQLLKLIYEEQIQIRKALEHNKE